MYSAWHTHYSEFLQGDRALLLARLQHRSGHFMKAALLDSQLAALEPPKDAFTVNIAATPAELVAQIRRQFGV